MPYSQNAEQNRSDIITNSIRTLKMDNIPEKKKRLSFLYLSRFVCWKLSD